MTTQTKTVARDQGRRLLLITAVIRQDDPQGFSDGFSITADLYEPHGTWSGLAQHLNGREPDYCGCLHDEILEFAPELAPLVTVHLAGLDGTPMHARANGWYFYSGKAREWEESRQNEFRTDIRSDLERAADALHIPVGALPAGMDHDAFEAFCDTLRPVWQAQADEARRVFEAMS